MEALGWLLGIPRVEVPNIIQEQDRRQRSGTIDLRGYVISTPRGRLIFRTYRRRAVLSVRAFLGSPPGCWHVGRFRRYRRRGYRVLRVYGVERVGPDLGAGFRLLLTPPALDRRRVALPAPRMVD